jgi:hypothetical protein
VKIDLLDIRVSQALSLIKELHKPADWRELQRLCEEKYHCKVVYEDEFGFKGHLDISEEKYQTWFLIQFGDVSE